MKHYVTNGSKKVRVHYSHMTLTDGRECVTLYAKDYGHALGSIFETNYENDTDMMTDYFDKGRVRIFPADTLFAAAKARCTHC
jgi:hypothetical protein